MKKKYADMDPLEEIRAIRKEIMREFKTLDALYEHLNKKYPSPDIPPSAKSRIFKTRKPSSGQRKTTKRLAHTEG